MSALLRVNINLPPDERSRLQTLAKAAKTPVAVYARELLVEALARAEGVRFRQRLEASRTPDRRARDREIALALERMSG
jgi:hypothetical protein